MASTLEGVAKPSRQEEGTRRDFLYLATGATAAVGTGALIWPLIDNMNPAADVLALASTEVDLEGIEVGQRITVTWRGRPVFIVRRTPEQIEQARADDQADLIDPEPDSARVIEPEWLIVVGVCTHLGCFPPWPEGGRSDRQVWWLVLPLPRLALRHLGPGAPRAGAGEPRRA